MGRSARQNEPFCSLKRAVLRRKMSHFASVKNVKETEGVCFQFFTTVSYFARTRPPDFFFRTLAFTEGKNELFVRFFQQ